MNDKAERNRARTPRSIQAKPPASDHKAASKSGKRNFEPYEREPRTLRGDIGLDFFAPEEAALLDSEENLEEESEVEESELLVRPALTVELSEDPVRLYLKEIGQIDLLNAESEFRLATRNEAKKRLEWLVEKEGGPDEAETHIQDVF